MDGYCGGREGVEDQLEFTRSQLWRDHVRKNAGYPAPGRGGSDGNIRIVHQQSRLRLERTRFIAVVESPFSTVRLIEEIDRVMSGQGFRRVAAALSVEVRR